MGKNKRNNKQQQQKQKQPAAAAQPATTKDNGAAESSPNATGAATGNKTSSHNNSHNSTNSAARARRFPPYTSQQRKELNTLILRLLELSQSKTSNANEEWKQYVEMQEMLQQIMKIEEPLQRVVCGDSNTSYADDQANRLAKVAAFTEWAKAGGVQTDSIEIAIFPGYQLGLQATGDIEADQQVLTVPRDLIFSEEHLPEKDRQIFCNYPLLTNFNLAYALVIEKVKGPKSSWRPYIDLLPARYNTVLYFSVEQMQRLRGTAACSGALRQCRVIARQFASMYKCAHIRPDQSVMASMGVLFTRHGLCYELYRWAVSTVMTRQNLVPREYLPSNSDQVEELKASPISALIPYWDMANHKPGKITSFYDKASHQLECTAQEAFKAGEQFFIFYGERPTADLLVHNGFLDMDNRADYVNIKLGLSPTDALLEQRASLLARLNIERKAELQVLPAPDYISGELLAFVRVFNMSAEQLEHWSSDPARVVDLLHIDCALETDHDRRTWQYLYQRLKLLLGVFDAALKEADELEQLASLRLTEGNEIDLMLLQYRGLERRIMSEALQYAQERCKV